MRNLLDEIDSGRRPALEKAIEWLETAAEVLKHDAVPNDGDCPFNKGDEAWFWFCLLANCPHATLHGPYMPLLPRHRSAREHAVAEGLCCAHCFAAKGCWIQTPLRRCSACKSVSYCGRDCQRYGFDSHKADCKRAQRALALEKARIQAQREDGILPAENDRPKLRCRHSLDGYGASVLALYEADDPDVIWGVVSVPTHDETMRNALKRGEARFNTDYYPEVMRALVQHKLVTPLEPGPIHQLLPGQAFGRIEVPLPETLPADEPKGVEAMLSKQQDPPPLDASREPEAP